LSGDYGNYINSSILSQYLVAMFNVEPVGGISKAWSLIEVPQVAPQVGIVHNAFLVALNNKTILILILYFVMMIRWICMFRTI